MPRGNAINWRDKDEKELRRIVRNFNAKVDRVTKKNPDIAKYQPAKISVKGLSESIETRRDFNNWKNQLQRYSRKGREEVKTSKTGLTLTVHSIKEANNQKSTINKSRARQVREGDLKIQNGTMGSIASNNLRPLKVDQDRSQKDWDKLISTMKNQSRENFNADTADNVKKIYLEMVKELLGSAGDELYSYVKALDSEFVYQQTKEKPLLAISYTSDPLPVDVIANSSLDEWKRVVGNQKIKVKT